MWTPDQLHQQMLDQLRQGALSADLERQRFRRLRKRWQVLRARLPSWKDTLIGIFAFGLLAGWLAVMVVHWPPGGGEETSDLVFTQGASLIFVVILLSLFSGPLAAGQRLGWDSGWVGRDTPTWLGLLLVALLSIALIWLGWVQPERAEEGASILLMAAGLCITALIAQRLIYLSDPGNQLDARFEAQLPRLMRTMKRRERNARKAFQRAGDSEVWKALELYAGPEIQVPISGIVRQYALATHRCAHDGDWSLAIRAHAVNIRLVKAYAQAVGALQLEDSVVGAFVEASDSLHETAGMPDARAFSKFVVTGMREVGLAVAARQLEAGRAQFLGGGADSGPLFAVEFRLQAMFKRRFADQQSEDPASAIRILGDLASAAIQVGDDWNAVGIQKFLLEWAPPATDRHFPHLAQPLWEESIRTMAELAVRASDDHAFSAAGDALDDAIDRTAGFPEFLHFSGFEPIVGASGASAKPSLPEAGYSIWRSEKVSVSDLVKWTWRTAYAVASLLRRTEEKAVNEGRRTSHHHAQHASEVVHQLVLAAGERALADGQSRAAISELTGRLLGALRHIVTDQTESSRSNDEAWHCYVTDFVVGLFVTRDEDLPEWLADEIQALTGVVHEKDSAVPEMLEPGLEWIAEAVARRPGVIQQAEELRALAKDAGDRIQRNRTWGWGLGGGAFYLHRGYVIAAVVEEAQTWLLSESVADGEAAAPPGEGSRSDPHEI